MLLHSTSPASCCLLRGRDSWGLPGSYQNPGIYLGVTPAAGMASTMKLQRHGVVWRLEGFLDINKGTISRKKTLPFRLADVEEGLHGTWQHCHGPRSAAPDSSSSCYCQRQHGAISGVIQEKDEAKRRRTCCCSPPPAMTMPGTGCHDREDRTHQHDSQFYISVPPHSPYSLSSLSAS
ncbi:uncharacterized protein LOC124659216 isoform X2 [Lolium rigidum]|uniref:uncharacterized protein LOC124659216 isoform X2 n=1 Tax=Lolium rigidum TaxID=89674 RepID=UPI001F5DB4CC|nr:uncharacterized protein LOC124659216 isoform X2 [Lolium rigidum]